MRGVKDFSPRVVWGSVMSAETPVSDLDARVEDLLRALTTVTDLAGLLEGVRAYEIALSLTPIDAPGVISAVDVASVWAALANVASEVLALREEADDGCTS